MPRQYSTQFRERVLGLVDEGRDIVELAGELEISSATIYRWRKQSKVDAGEIAGVTVRLPRSSLMRDAGSVNWKKNSLRHSSQRRC
jgi:transposase-like protein